MSDDNQPSLSDWLAQDNADQSDAPAEQNQQSLSDWLAKNEDVSDVTSKQTDNSGSAGDYRSRLLKAEGTTKNPNSSAVGPGQFVDKTWLGIVNKHFPDRIKGMSDDDINALRNPQSSTYDPSLTQASLEALTEDNESYLRSHGIPVTDSTRYAAHLLGPDGARKIFFAPDDATVDTITTPEAVNGNVGLLSRKDQNGNITPLTIGEAKQNISKKIGDSYFPQHEEATEALEAGAKGLLPALGQDIAGAASVALDPSKWGPAASAAEEYVNSIRKGVLSYTNEYAGHPVDPVQAQIDRYPLQQLIHYIPNTYGTLEGTLDQLAHRPDRVATDVATFVPGLGSAVKGAGTVAGLAGDVGAAGLRGVGLSGAADAVSGAGEAVAGGIGKVGAGISAVGNAANPLNPMGVTGKVIDKITGNAPAKVVVAGKLSPEVVKNLPDDFTETDFDSLDSADKQTFLRTLQTKGTSPEAINEAIMKTAGTKAATSMVMNVAPPHGLEKFIEDVKDENNETLAKQAAASGHPLSDTAIGSALEDAHDAQVAKNKQMYDAVRAIPGSFGKNMSKDNLDAAIDARLSALGGTRIANLESNGFVAEDHPETVRAIDAIRSSLVHENYQASDATKGINAEEIMKLRQGLSQRLRDANGSDQKTVGAVIDGFHDFIRDAEQKKLFKLDDGTPAPGLIKPLEDANAQYRNYFDTFHNSDLHGGKMISNAVKKLQESPGDADVQRAVQADLENSLMHGTKGAAHYRTLKNAIGDSDPIDRVIRARMMEHIGNPLGENKKFAPLIKQRNGIVDRAFANDKAALSRARLLHAAHRLNNRKPNRALRAHSLLSGLFNRTAMRVAAPLLGLHLGHGHGAMTEAAAAIGAEMLEGLTEAGMNKFRTARELRGAPAKRNLLAPVGAVLKTPTRPLLAGPMLSAQSQQRQQRASGGKVEDDIEPLVQRLMDLADKAKKVTNNTTKPLLNLPDETVVKALAVAQKAI